DENVTDLLEGRTLDELLTFKPEFEADIIGFIGNEKLADLVGLVSDNEELKALFGDKTVSVVYYEVDGKNKLDMDALAAGMRFADLLALLDVEHEGVNELLADRTVDELITFEPFKVTLYEFFMNTRVLDVLDTFKISARELDVILRDKTFAQILDKEPGQDAKFSLEKLMSDVVINDLVNAVIGRKNRSLEKWGMDYFYEGMVIGEVITFKGGFKFSLNREGLMRNVSFKRILDDIKANPTSEATLIYLVAGAAVFGYLFLTKRDKLMNYDFGQALTRFGIENVYLHNLLDGKAMADLVDLKATEIKKVVTWYEFSQDMRLKDILGLLKKDNNAKINAIVRDKTIGDLFTSAPSLRMSFFADVYLGDLMPGSGIKAMFAEVPLNVLFRMANGSSGAMSMHEFLYVYAGDELAFDMAKLLVGENDIIKGVLGENLISDLIIKDGENYSFNPDVFGKAKMGDLFGYTIVDHDNNPDTDNKVYDKAGNEVVGVLAVLSNTQIKDIEDTINHTHLGDVLGYHPHEDTWYEEYYGHDHKDNVVAEGLMLELCDLTIHDLTDHDLVASKIRNIKVAQVFGMDKRGGVWYESKESNVKASPILAYLAETKIADLSSGIDDMQLGVAFGYHQGTGSDNKWYTADGKEATGVIAAFAGLAVKDMSNDTKVRDAINGVTIGEIMGYTEKNGVWYVSYNGPDDNQPVTGVLKVVAGSKVGDVEGAINSAPIGELLNYQKNEADGKWYYYPVDTDPNDGITPPLTQVTGISAAIADTPVQGLTTRMSSIAIYELFGYEKHEGVWYTDATHTTRVTGMMVIIGLDTKVSEIDDRLTKLFDGYDDPAVVGDEDATIGQFADAGILILNSETVTALGNLFTYSKLTGNPYVASYNAWTEMSLTPFINWIINIATSVIPTT
ncbi:MAG: hypothetical protein J6R42_03060, partial [Clostridia bacterium]|nr:hypothetical protein [Clostridia bacterium]